MCLLSHASRHEPEQAIGPRGRVAESELETENRCRKIVHALGENLPLALADKRNRDEGAQLAQGGPGILDTCRSRSRVDVKETARTAHDTAIPCALPLAPPVPRRSLCSGMLSAVRRKRHEKPAMVWVSLCQGPLGSRWPSLVPDVAVPQQRSMCPIAATQ